MNKSSVFLSSISVLVAIICIQGSLLALHSKPFIFSAFETAFLLYTGNEEIDVEKGTGHFIKEGIYYNKNLGMAFEVVSDKLSAELGISTGIKIKEFLPGPIHKQSFLTETFIITQVNGEEVTSLEKLYRILKKEPKRVRFEGVYNDLLMAHDDFGGNFQYEIMIDENW